jgi:hypothetical protein
MLMGCFLGVMWPTCRTPMNGVIGKLIHTCSHDKMLKLEKLLRNIYCAVKKLCGLLG